MQKLMLVVSIMFVAVMIRSSVFAQSCASDGDCIDSDLCTVDICDATQAECIFTPVVCDDGDPATADSCDPDTGACIYAPIVCDDEDACTVDEYDETTGECVFTPIICEDGDPATTDSCNPVTGECTSSLMVSVDIKPGSCQNPLNVRSRGILPVVIYGAEAFDVSSLDPTAIGFSIEGVDTLVPPLRWSYEDVGAPPLNGKQCTCDDIDEEDIDEDESLADGFTDLKLKFSVPSLVEGLGLAAFGRDQGKPRATVLLSIVAINADGTPVMGQDCVQIINKWKWWEGPQGPKGPKEPNGPKDPKRPNRPNRN
jgi:hypothetical protein